MVVGRLVWLRHARYATFAFDLGIFDQAVWLLAHGRQFITVRGLPVFGHHANLGLVVFVPFYWLGAGPQLLNMAMVASLSLGAAPVYLLARDRLHSRTLGLVLAAAFLLHPSLQYLAWETFHPDGMAITPLLFAAWFACNRRWRAAGIAAVVALVWKEDVALFLAAAGVVLAVRGRWRLGAVVTVSALAYFLVVNRLVVPAVAGIDEAFYNHFFGDIGSSPVDIARTALTEPSAIADRLTAADAREYLLRLVAPYGFVPLLSPLALVPGLPQVLVNLLSVQGFTRDFRFHYVSLPLVALTVAAVEGIRHLQRLVPAAGVALAALVAGAAVATTVMWQSPLGDANRPELWGLGADERRAAKAAAVARVPARASVSATYQLVPHLTHRPEVYDWPNPFLGRNWGVDDDDALTRPPPEWLVVDTVVIGDDERALLARLTATDYSVVTADDGVVVARRDR